VANTAPDGGRSPELARLVAAVTESAKYRRVAPGLVAAIGAGELAKGRSWKEAVKATKNKLHQVAGAYLPERPDYDGWLARLAQASTPADQAEVCKAIMAHHASTRERLPALEQFYITLFAGLSPITSILDLACGLNPLARPWMPLAPDASYFACDIYQDQANFLNRCFALLGVTGQATVCDLVQAAPEQEADVALLLKAIPCLEQMDRGIGPRLLDQVRAPVVILSYPAQSLGGRQKGMVTNYAAHFEALAAGRPWQVTRYDFPRELVFRIIR
jgi:16S rRNA (guanine(1405)-N(7))-methyltransferase